MENMNNRGEAFKVIFSVDVSFVDPEYRSLSILINGETEVVSADWSGDESSVKYVTTIIKNTIMDEIMRFGDQNASYKAIQSDVEGISNACINVLQNKGFTVLNFVINSIGPNQRSLEMIDKIDKLKAMANMSPEEHAKRYQEAMQAAQQTLAMQQASVTQQTLTSQQNQSTGQAGYPKFCPNCGTPTTGSNFCTNCGNKLR